MTWHFSFYKNQLFQVFDQKLSHDTLIKNLPSPCVIWWHRPKHLGRHNLFELSQVEMFLTKIRFEVPFYAHGSYVTYTNSLMRKLGNKFRKWLAGTPCASPRSAGWWSDDRRTPDRRHSTSTSRLHPLRSGWIANLESQIEKILSTMDSTYVCIKKLLQTSST